MNLIQRGTTASRANRGKSVKKSIAHSNYYGGYQGKYKTLRQAADKVCFEFVLKGRGLSRAVSIRELRCDFFRTHLKLVPQSRFPKKFWFLDTLDGSGACI